MIPQLQMKHKKTNIKPILDLPGGPAGPGAPLGPRWPRGPAGHAHEGFTVRGSARSVSLAGFIVKGSVRSSTPTCVVTDGVVSERCRLLVRNYGNTHKSC